MTGHAAFQQQAWQLQQSIDRQDQAVCCFRDQVQRMERRRQLGLLAADPAARLGGVSSSVAQLEDEIADVIVGGRLVTVPLQGRGRVQQSARRSGLVAAIAARTAPPTLAYFEGLAMDVDVHSRKDCLRQVWENVLTAELPRPPREPLGYGYPETSGHPGVYGGGSGIDGALIASGGGGVVGWPRSRGATPHRRHGLLASHGSPTSTYRSY